MFKVCSMLSVCSGIKYKLYVFLYADFLAATQIVIYVGGILVLIIFGVMLTNKIDKPVIASNSSNKVMISFNPVV